MKRVLFCVFALVLVTNLGMSQVSFGGGAQMGISIAMFPDAVKDYYGMGLGFGGHGDVNIIKYVTVRLGMDYYTFGFDSKKFLDLVAKQNNVAASTLDMSGLRINDLAITVSGIGKVPLRGVVTPYGILGFGLNFISSSDPKVTYNGNDVTAQLGMGKGDSSTKFGLHFGAGSEFHIGMVKAYFEIKYAMIFTEGKNTNHLPLTIGVTF
jgi:opacity protein-like surface antigen